MIFNCNLAFSWAYKQWDFLTKFVFPLSKPLLNELLLDFLAALLNQSLGDPFHFYTDPDPRIRFVNNIYPHPARENSKFFDTLFQSKIQCSSVI